MTMKKLLGISLALVMLIGSVPLGFSEPLRVQLEQGIETDQIQCDNPNHVLVQRSNGNMACVTERTAEKTGWEKITSDVITQTEYSESVSLNSTVTTLTLEDSETIILSVSNNGQSSSKWCTEWPKTSIEIPSIVQVGVPFDVTYNWTYVLKNDQGEILNMLFEEENNECTSNQLLITKPYFVDIKNENFVVFDERTDWKYIPAKIYQTGTIDDFEFDNTESHSEIISMVIQDPEYGNTYGYFEFGANNQFTSANIIFDGDYATIRDAKEIVLSFDSLTSKIPDDEKIFNATTSQINHEKRLNDPQYQERMENYKPTLPDIGEIVDYLQEYHPDKDLNDELLAIGYSQEEIDEYFALGTQFFSPVLNWILPQALAVPPPSIYITGQATYTNQNNIVSPLVDVQVCFWDIDENGQVANEVKNGVNQACGQTSSTGNYGILAEIDDPDDDGSTIDLVVAVGSKGSEFQIVRTGTVNGEPSNSVPNNFLDEDNAQTNVPSFPSVYDHGITEIPIDEVLTEALYLLDDLQYAEDWIDSNLGYDVPSLEVYWMEGRCFGTYYDTVNTKMWLDGNNGICPVNHYTDIVYHEYGHHLMVSVYNDHDSDLPYVTADCSNHNPLTNINNECAWVEGWGSFVPTMIKNDSTNTEFIWNGGSSITDININYEDGYVYAFLNIPQTDFPSGADNEGRVTAGLWDLIDGTGEQDNVNTERVDDINQLMTAMWFTFDDNLNGETVIADNILDYRDDWNDNGFQSLDSVYYLNTLDTFVPSPSEPEYDIFYSNYDTEDIYRTDTDVSTLGQFIAKYSDGLLDPGAIAIGSGNDNDKYLFVLQDRGANMYRFDTRTGDAYGVGGDTTDAKIRLATSFGISDIEMRSDGYLFLSSGGSSQIKYYNTNGNVLYPSFTHFDFTGSTTNVGGMAFDSNDALYIVDVTNGAILKYDGSNFNIFVANGIGGLADPFDIAIGYNDALYVSSTLQDKIYRFDNTGTPSGGSGSTTDATYTTTDLDEPSHIVFSPGLSTLYIANYRDDTILSIDTFAAGSPIVEEFIADNGNTDQPFGITVGPIVVPDSPPLLMSISDKYLSENTTTEIIVKAFDNDDDTIALTLSSNNSTFTSINDYGNGTATITMSPVGGDAGFYSVIVKAVANSAEGTEDFDIIVNAVVDNTPPTLTVPSDKLIETTVELTILNSTQIGVATATDNIDPSPVITNNATDIITNGFPLGDTVILWNATDNSENSATDIQTITIIPIISKDIPSSTGSGSITVLTDKGILSNATSIDESTLPIIGKPSVSFPHGFIALNVTGLDNGDTIIISITLPTNVPADSQYWKVINDVWTNATSILGSNDGDDTITLTLTDGGAYDADGQTDGTITDPGGIGSPEVDTTPPRIDTINRQDPSAETTTNSILTFRVTFDEPVTGVDQTDFTTNGTATSTVTGFTANNVTQYDVVATVTTDGIVSLGLNSTGHGITDTAIIPNSLTNATSLTTPQTYTVTLPDTTRPVITLNPPNPQTIELGDGYTELGATTDDGSPVTIDDSDFVDLVDSYSILYDSVDNAGNNATQVIRTVNVVDTTSIVSDHIKIADNLSGFNPLNLDLDDRFGSSVTNIGDYNGDGIDDLAVGAFFDENIGDGRSEFNDGVLYILFMNSDGTVQSHIKISDGLAGFDPLEGLDGADAFGKSVANIGDYDGNGINDLAVGAFFDDNGIRQQGALYILFMDEFDEPSGNIVKNNIKISDGLAGFTPSDLGNGDRFGSSVANIGDYDGNGVNDLAVGAYRDENNELQEGALYILLMDKFDEPNIVLDHIKISDGLAGFEPLELDDYDAFGFSVANIGDYDDNGVNDLAVGARGDETTTDIENQEGALYILFMDTFDEPSGNIVKDHVKISDNLSGFYPSDLDYGDKFGFSVTNIGDYDGNGINDLAVGAPVDENVQGYDGAVYILLMDKFDEPNIVLDHIKIADGLSGFTPSGLDGADAFGSSVAKIGDYLAVGAQKDENGELNDGSLYILFME